MRSESPTERTTLNTVFLHCFATLLWLIWMPGTAGAATPAATDDLSELSLEQLMNIEVTSVSKRAQKISQAPAAVTVVTAEDIRRAGATTIPEALRMVPGLHVAHIDNNRMAITARGFNGLYANKLLVLIDGRTVYTPLFSGVYWDVKDVVLEDIERIEVVRGPGGTLWGANAVNGVINIITKKSKDTSGAMLSGGGGSLEDGIASLRYGRSITDDVHARVYGKYLHTDTLDPPTLDPTSPYYGDVNDARRIGSTGFRVDWDALDDNTFTFQGDYYNGEADYFGQTSGADTQDVWGVNLLARWQSSFTENSDFSAQVYYDRNVRDSRILDQTLNTIDVELQYGFGGLPIQRLTVGANYRVNWDDLRQVGLIGFSPSSSTDHLISGFIQDEISVLPDLLTLIVGSKFEYNQFTEFEFQPNLRLLATPHPRHTIWAAVSRAVRTPARAESDIDIDFTIAGLLNYRYFGDRGLDAEDLLAVELGYRTQLHDRISLDVAAYFNKYDELMIYDTATPGSGGLPACPTLSCTWLRYGNKEDGIGWGAEVSATWAVFEFENSIAWRLMAAYTYMDLDLDLKNSASATALPLPEGTTPLHQLNVRSQLDLPWNVEADAALYFVDDVTSPGIDRYPRVDVRLGWQPTDNIELSLLGRNLQERRHLEHGPGLTSIVNSSVPRSVFAKAVFRY